MSKVPLYSPSEGGWFGADLATVTSKVSTGASKSLYQSRPRTVAFSKNVWGGSAQTWRQTSMLCSKKFRLSCALG